MSTIIKGSILDIAKGQDTALALMGAKIAIVCDRSGSMVDQVNGRATKHAVQNAVIGKVQERHPGQVAIVAFNDTCDLCLDGVVPDPFGTTNIGRAFATAQELADLGLKIVFMSDGEDEGNEDNLIAYARAHLAGMMDVIYVGSHGGSGEAFMELLAQVVAGRYQVHDFGDDPELLTAHLEQLLLKAGE